MVLRKDGGGVRGIVAGERLSGQSSNSWDPKLHYCVSTRTGSACRPCNVLQVFTEWDPESTNISTGLVRSTPQCFVRVFCSSLVDSWEGGEQGDALMPLLFLGQEANQRDLNLNEKFFVFLDDLCLVSNPDRVGALHNLVQRELWGQASAGSRPWQKIRVEPRWVKPEACEVLQSG